jgi:hypothetical protein
MAESSFFKPEPRLSLDSNVVKVESQDIELTATRIQR